MPDPIDPKLLANQIAEAEDTDVIMISGPMERGIEARVADVCARKARRTNAHVFVVTNGGDADVAYRIARCLQEHYTDGEITALVAGVCKSAGTLLVIGAHNLAMGDHGELGPLDVQLRKSDELWANTSGLTVMNAFTALQSKSEEAFAEFAASIKVRSGGSVTFKTAADIAQKLTVGLFSHIYQQVEVMHVGEAARAMKVAEEYGRRLDEEADNLLSASSLGTLVAGYPSHGFVIDRKEAADLFRNVRALTTEEVALCNALGNAVRTPNNTPRLTYLSDPPKPKAATNDTQQAIGTGAAGQEPRAEGVVEPPAPAPQAEPAIAEVVRLPVTGAERTGS